MNKTLLDTLQLKQKLIEIRKSIRKKLLAIKLNKSEQDEALKRTYKPLLDPLKEIVSSKDNNSNNYPKFEHQRSNIKAIKRKLEKDEGSSTKIEPTILKKKKNDRYDGGDDGNGDLLHTFLDDFHSNKEDLFDTNENYAIKHDPTTSKWSIGSSEIRFGVKNIVVHDIKYEATKGLYELLLKKKPVHYNDIDLQNYNDIIIKSNAIRKGYDPNSQIQPSRTFKYKYIIKPLIAKTIPTITTTITAADGVKKRSASLNRKKQVTGQGYNKFDQNLILNNKKFEYVYWDDVNELVDRLYLLHASKKAGNTAHNNEIISIEEELREANIIV